MGTTRTERAIDELDMEGDDFEPSCDDIRLAWLANEMSAGSLLCNEFEALWSER